MNVHLPHPYGRHSRSFLGTLVDEVRRSLLLALPEQPPIPESVTRVEPKVLRRKEWHAVATGFGDMVEDVAAFAAVAFIVLFGLLTVAILLWFAPWPLRAVLLAAFVGVAVGVVWFRRVHRRLDDVDSDIRSIEDGAR